MRMRQPPVLNGRQPRMCFEVAYHQTVIREVKGGGYLSDAVVGISKAQLQPGDNIFVDHHLRRLARLPLYEDGKILAGDAEPVGIVLNILRLHEVMLEDVHKPGKEFIGALRVNIGVAQFRMLAEEIGKAQKEALQLQGDDLISHATAVSGEEMLQDGEHGADDVCYNLPLPAKSVVSQREIDALFYMQTRHPQHIVAIDQHYTMKIFNRFAALLSRGAVTQQQYDNAKTRYEQAHSRWMAARARLTQASASRTATAGVAGEQRYRLGQSRAGESVADAQLNLARLNLSYTVITAPCDGYVGRKDIFVGQLVQPGQLLTRVIDDAEVWVIANYRESQMKHVTNGEAVTFTCDAVPGVTFNGRVKSISAASGAAYAGQPVDNATGNFVKVEQRVPVRIELTRDNKAADIRKLLSGLNVETEVHY